MEKVHDDAKRIAQEIVNGDYPKAQEIWKEATTGMMAFECVVLRHEIEKFEKQLQEITGEDTGPQY